MSDTRVTIGYMAVLTVPLPEDDYEDLMQNLWDSKYNLELNYDCNIIFSTDVDVPIYEFGIQVGSPSTETYFLEAVKESGFDIDVSTIKPYTCVWYDGADSDMSTLTLQEFNK